MFYKIKTDKNFSNFIYWTRGISRISDILSYDDFVNPFGNYVAVDPKEFDTVSYIPQSKVDISAGFRDEKYRTRIKIGRFVSKVITEFAMKKYNITQSEIENFVNLFKSYFNVDSSKFKIISGPEILHWYLEENYYMPGGRAAGTLWNSCMRYLSKNKFMEIYSANPDKIKMIINLDDDGKLRTRALLWEECVDMSGKVYKVMDRIYSIYDHETTAFIKWSKENGYIHKLDQSSKNEVYFVTDNGSEVINLKIKLDHHEFRYYPYVDTFKFYNREEGVLKNWNSSRMDAILIQNNGSLVGEPVMENHNDFDDDDDDHPHDDPTW